MKEISAEEFHKEAWELSNELDKLISYDEWAGREYGENRVDHYDTACNLIRAGYRKAKRKFFDIETREILTEDDLARELAELQKQDHEHDGWTLEDYIYNCLTIHNGTLEEI